LASIGNLRISVRYRDRPPSGEMTASEFVAMARSPRRFSSFSLERKEPGTTLGADPPPPLNDVR
jgi:hypothetical protein